eukprot:182877-Chlamydomonas_euryale.AAC.3
MPADPHMLLAHYSVWHSPAFVVPPCVDNVWVRGADPSWMYLGTLSRGYPETLPTWSLKGCLKTEFPEHCNRSQSGKQWGVVFAMRSPVAARQKPRLYGRNHGRGTSWVLSGIWPVGALHQDFRQERQQPGFCQWCRQPLPPPAAKLICQWCRHQLPHSAVKLIWCLLSTNRRRINAWQRARLPN